MDAAAKDELSVPTISKLKEEAATIEDFFSDEDETDEEMIDSKGGGDTVGKDSTWVRGGGGVNLKQTWLKLDLVVVDTE